MSHPFLSDNLDKFFNQVSQTLGIQFVAFYQYGEEKKSHLLILKSASCEVLDLLQKVHKQFQKYPVTYHVMTEEEVRHSQDVFPIEFLEMKENRRLLAGKDILDEVTVNLIHMRHECEFYLRSNIMKLREGYLNPKRQLSGLIRESLPSFISVFKAFHTCQNQPIPTNKKETMASLSLRLSINSGIFSEIFEASPTQNIDHLFGTYLETLTQVADKIDTF